MFTQPAALLFFVSEELPDREPFQGLFEFSLMRGDNAGQCRCQLWSQGDFSLALIHEIKKLSHDFVTALFFVEFGWFENRAIPFNESVASTDFAPLFKNVISCRTNARQEISE